MVVPIGASDGARAKTPTAPELSPTREIPPRMGQDGAEIHFKVGNDESDIVVPEQLLRTGCLADFIRQNNRLISNNTFSLKHIDKDSFEMLIKHLLGEEVKFSSIPNALTALKTGQSMECSSFCRLAVSYCDLNLSSKNILEILKTTIPMEEHMVFSIKWVPSYLLDPGASQRLEIKSLVYALNQNCGLIFDENHEIILSEEFLNLDKEFVPHVLVYTDRPLFKSSIIFDKIKQWMDGRDPKKTDNREYFLMTEEEFLEGPAKSGLLTQEEVDKVLNYLRKLPTRSLAPYNLSQRTINGCPHICYARENCPNFQKSKKEKKSSKLFLGFLRCWQVVFD